MGIWKPTNDPEYYSNWTPTQQPELYHFGVKGMKWGKHLFGKDKAVQQGGGGGGDNDGILSEVAESLGVTLDELKKNFSKYREAVKEKLKSLLIKDQKKNVLDTTGSKIDRTGLITKPANYINQTANNILQRARKNGKNDYYLKKFRESGNSKSSKKTNEKNDYYLQKFREAETVKSSNESKTPTSTQDSNKKYTRDEQQRNDNVTDAQAKEHGYEKVVDGMYSKKLADDPATSNLIKELEREQEARLAKEKAEEERRLQERIKKMEAQQEAEEAERRKWLEKRDKDRETYERLQRKRAEEKKQEAEKKKREELEKELNKRSVQEGWRKPYGSGSGGGHSF